MELIQASVMVTLSDQYQLQLTKKHNLLRWEFVLRGLSYDHVNAVPSLLLRFFSLVILFSKGWMSSRNFPFVFYTPSQESLELPAFFIPCNYVVFVSQRLISLECRLNSWNINSINKNCNILDYRSILLTDAIF